MVVQASPASPELEGEFNRWYDEDHVPELLTLAGFTAARRYRRFPSPGADPAAGPGYLTIYEVEADDLAAALAAMRARPRGKPSEALCLDPPPVVAFYELLDQEGAVTQEGPQ
jgi:hypothetical protein